MIPTHATKAGVRYRYYVSTPFLHGEAKTASAGSVPRVPAADIEDTVVKCLREHLAARQDKSAASAVRLGDRDDLVQLVAGVVVHRDRLIVLCPREKCSVRQINMTISLAFLAPNLVKAAVESRLPRGIGIERLRDPPPEWSRQFEALGLNPE